MTDHKENKARSTSKKKKKRKISILRVLILIFLFLGFISAGIVGGLVVATVKSAKPIDPTKIYTLLDENSIILDKEGHLIEKVESEGLRAIVKYHQIPDHLKEAFIAIEDKNFRTHSGISPKRIIGALWEDLKAGAPVQGASTITQQLAKNLYLTHDKKIDRKIKEAFYALQLEKQLTKDQILEAYLNTAYMGSGAKGVQAAAHTYFSKDVSELDLAESALIAGITKNPSKFSPLKTLKKEDIDLNKHFIIDDSDEIYTIVFDERYKERQHLVLKIMLKEGKISEDEYQQAINEDMKERLKPGKKSSTNISSYFVDEVKNEVVQALMLELDKSEEEAWNMIDNQGLRIYSTLDLQIQKTLEKAYEDSKNFPNLAARKDKSGNILSKSNSILLFKYSNLINDNKNFIIPKEDYQYDQEGNLVLFKGKRLNFEPLYENGEIESVQILTKDSYMQDANKEYLMFKGGSVKIPSQYKNYDENKNVIIEQQFLSENPNFFNKDNNGNLLISKENYYVSDKGVIQPQSAMVIMDYRTGEIKALVGGRDVKGRRIFNRAINPRQPGSSIKPLAVYLPALDNGWTAADVVDDVPFYDHNGNLWPKNYTNDYSGLSTLREGVQWSNNVLAVKILEKIGVTTAVDYLTRLGITTVDQKGGTNDLNLAALGLGGMTKGISPLELTAAYGAVANQGVYVKPISFTKITDREGNIILENSSYKNMVVKPETAFILTDMMRTGVSAGTGHRAKLDNSNSIIPVAGKTGTTSDNFDAWFAGYTPYYVGAVWIGNDVQIELDSGSSRSATLWSTVMSQIHKGLPPREFDKPKNIVTALIDTESGKLATDLSQRDPRGSTVRTEYFALGTEPKEYDDVHVELEVDVTTNKLATPYCPPTLIENRVFVRRMIPYYPYNNNGITPKDYIYSAPLDQCNTHSPLNSTIPGFPTESTPPTIPGEPNSDQDQTDLIDSSENTDTPNN